MCVVKLIRKVSLRLATVHVIDRLKLMKSGMMPGSFFLTKKFQPKPHDNPESYDKIAPFIESGKITKSEYVAQWPLSPHIKYRLGTITKALRSIITNELLSNPGDQYTTVYPKQAQHKFLYNTAINIRTKSLYIAPFTNPTLKIQH